MKCKNCKKEIDNDSKFCIYCGTKLEKQPLVKKINETEKAKRKGKESFKVALIVLSLSLLFISVVINIILGVNLSKNIGYVEDYKEEARNLSNEISTLKLENSRLSNDLKRIKEDYNILKSNYKNIENNYNNLLRNSDTTSSNEIYGNYYNNEEITFLNRIKGLLDEYNLAANHMNTYHKDNWIFNDPSEIALEETFLVKLQELSNNLKNFPCPNSFTNHKNNLISIFEEICHYKMLQIECMKNNNYDCNIANYNALESSVGRLFDYYNSIVE